MDGVLISQLILNYSQVMLKFKTQSPGIHCNSTRSTSEMSERMDHIQNVFTVGSLDQEINAKLTLTPIAPNIKKCKDVQSKVEVDYSSSLIHSRIDSRNGDSCNGNAQQETTPGTSIDPSTSDCSHKAASKPTTLPEPLRRTSSDSSSSSKDVNIKYILPSFPTAKQRKYLSQWAYSLNTY